MLPGYHVWAGLLSEEQLAPSQSRITLEPKERLYESVLLSGTHCSTSLIALRFALRRDHPSAATGPIPVLLSGEKCPTSHSPAGTAPRIDCGCYVFFKFILDVIIPGHLFREIAGL